MKKISEVFGEYKTTGNIGHANIETMNVIKKTNTLEIKLVYDEHLEFKDIWYFESYLMERFKFASVELSINYHEGIKAKSVEKEWKNIIAYMSHKYPLARPMLLLKSDIEVNGNILKIKMRIQGAEFLKAKKVDVELQKVIANIMGIQYNVEITEELSSEEIEKQRNANSQIEEDLAKEKQKQLDQIQENEDTGIVEKPKEAIVKNEQQNSKEYPEEIKEAEALEEKEYIMGRPVKGKDKRVEIKEIGPTQARIVVEARVLDMNLIETKTGKGMLIFEIYDGTGTIVCKSFAKDMEEGERVKSEIEKAVKIKIFGKAGLDTYANDVTIMANAIVATDTEIPEMLEEDNSNPVILGREIQSDIEKKKIIDIGEENEEVVITGKVIASEEKSRGPRKNHI